MIKRIGSHIDKFGILFVGILCLHSYFLFGISPGVAPTGRDPLRSQGRVCGLFFDSTPGARGAPVMASL